MSSIIDRGQRIFAERKKKAKCRRIIREVWQEPTLAGDSKFIGRMAHTPHPCSCLGCGNPRRKSKGKETITLQERKVDESNGS
jgi:hypothetical protein